MKYQNKLSASICAGAVISFAGNFANQPLLTSAGLGLIASGHMGAFLETDEFEKLREESQKRERLYNQFQSK